MSYFRPYRKGPKIRVKGTKWGAFISTHPIPSWRSKQKRVGSMGGGDESKRRNGENCPGEGERKGGSGRGKRFIVFKPEIERTRWKQRRRKEGREG